MLGDNTFIQNYRKKMMHRIEHRRRLEPVMMRLHDEQYLDLKA